MVVTAPCPLLDFNETMVVWSPILASAQFYEHPDKDKDGVHTQLLPPVHGHLHRAWGWLLFKPQKQRGIVGGNGILPRLDPVAKRSGTTLFMCFFGLFLKR